MGREGRLGLTPHESASVACRVARPVARALKRIDFGSCVANCSPRLRTALISVLLLSDNTKESCNCNTGVSHPGITASAPRFLACSNRAWPLTTQISGLPSKETHPEIDRATLYRVLEIATDVGLATRLPITRRFLLHLGKVEYRTYSAHVFPLHRLRQRRFPRHATTFTTQVARGIPPRQNGI